MQPLELPSLAASMRPGEVILLVVRTMREGERPALVGKEETSAALMEI
jgi:hypothetical protein